MSFSPSVLLGHAPRTSSDTAILDKYAIGNYSRGGGVCGGGVAVRTVIAGGTVGYREA